MVKIAITIPRVNMTDGEDVGVQMILVNVYLSTPEMGTPQGQAYPGVPSLFTACKLCACTVCLTRHMQSVVISSSQHSVLPWSGMLRALKARRIQVSLDNLCITCVVCVL